MWPAAPSGLPSCQCPPCMPSRLPGDSHALELRLQVKGARAKLEPGCCALEIRQPVSKAQTLGSRCRHFLRPFGSVSGKQLAGWEAGCYLEEVRKSPVRGASVGRASPPKAALLGTSELPGAFSKVHLFPVTSRKHCQILSPPGQH